MIVSHNLTAMNADRQFNINRKNKEKLAEKLSSGFRINRSADDAAGLAISEKMRRQIRGLDRASENIKDGISLCNVADGALNEIHDIMQRQRQLLIQAGNDTNSDTDKEYIQQEVTQLSKEFDRIFDTTDFNTILIFKGKDTILDGPTVNDSTIGPNQTVDTINEHISTRMVWAPSGKAPQDSSVTVTTTGTDVNVKHYDTETMLPPDEDGHSPYLVSKVTDTITTDTTVDTTTKTTYTAVTDSKFINDSKTLNTPQESIRSSTGYLNSIKNKAGSLDLSCAMSQLGVKVDGNLVDVSVYNSRCKGTTFSANGEIAESKYDIGNNLELTQKVELKGGNMYEISFSVASTDGVDHDIELRFAFDVMNTKAKSVNDGSTTAFSLESDFASIDVKGYGSSATLNNSMLGTINDLYGDENWDGQAVVHDKDVWANHVGIGYWWDGKVTAGNTLDVGRVEYGPIGIGDPYYEDVDREIKTTKDVTTDRHQVDTKIMPTYLDIQAGTEKGVKIPIRLWNLSAAELNVRPGTDITVKNIGDSLDNIDNAFEKINNIRSYYGAMTNRLEHAYNVNRNTEENTQAAESIIRDTDMAKTMVAYSNHNIIEQAGNSMLAQANQSNRDVLSLLG